MPHSLLLVVGAPGPIGSEGCERRRAGQHEEVHYPEHPECVGMGFYGEVWPQLVLLRPPLNRSQLQMRRIKMTVIGEAAHLLW